MERLIGAAAALAPRFRVDLLDRGPDVLLHPHPDREAPAGAVRRLIVRRTRLTGEQAELFPDWRHLAFLTNRTEALGVVEAEHRAHAVVELAIRDLKTRRSPTSPPGGSTPTPPGR